MQATVRHSGRDANQVHFIANTNEAQVLNGTPYGNAGRNVLRDYKTNSANFQVAKTVNWGERARIIWHMSMVNAFNHPNYASIDPFLEDAGLVVRTQGSLIQPSKTGVVQPGPRPPEPSGLD